MKVAEVMSRRVKTCRPHNTVAEAMRLMWEHDLGAIPVVNEDGQPIAMITDRDIAVAAYTQGRPLHEISVQSAMSRELHTAHVDDNVSVAERILRVHQLHRLPVVDESTRLAGVLTLNDLALAYARSTLNPTGDPALEEVALTLGAIARPRTVQTKSEPPAAKVTERPNVRSSQAGSGERARPLASQTKAASRRRV